MWTSQYLSLKISSKLGSGKKSKIPNKSVEMFNLKTFVTKQDLFV